MKVKQLILELKKCNPNLRVKMFAHDQKSERYDEGVGFVRFVDEIKDNQGDIFIALQH